MGLAVHENFGLLRTWTSGHRWTLPRWWMALRLSESPTQSFQSKFQNLHRKFRSCCICNMTPGVQDSRDKYVGKLSQEALAAVVAIKGKIAGFKNSKEKGKIILADIDQQTQRNFAFSCSTHCFFLSSVPSIPSGIEIVSLSLATFALFI